MFGESPVRSAFPPVALAAACLAATVAIGAGSAVAQQRSNVQAEQNRDLNDRVFGRGLPTNGRYVAGDQAFILDRSGPRPLLRFEESNEVWALRPTPAPRGDVIYRNDAGETVLRATRDGALTLYTEASPGGVPVSSAGAGRSVTPPRISPLQLVNFLVRQSGVASQAAGRLIYFDAREISPGSEQMVADAAAVAVEAIVRLSRDTVARGQVRQIRQIIIIEGDRPSATLSGGVLTLTIQPALGPSGRPSSARIVRAVSTR